MAEAATVPDTSAQIPVIVRLSIDRFRGINNLVWYPKSGINIILGGGDVGKTTILDAIGLLLNPTNSAVLLDTDFWDRDVPKGFCIEAVMSLPDSTMISQQTKHSWPWHWNGTEAVLPPQSEDGESSANNAVYRVRARGTQDFDLVYEVVQPDGTEDHFSTSTRRSIGLVRLGGDDKNDRDLRLVQGSALERLLSDKTLRARLGSHLGEADIKAQLKGDAQTALTSLDDRFKKCALPHDLSLGLIGGQGFSINALIGLTAKKRAQTMPVSSWGAGTRRLAALEIAASQQNANPVVLVDELERGLEPYRQRLLVKDLADRQSQVFITTHSATVLRAATKASIWFLDHQGGIGELGGTVARHVVQDPETFLSRVAVVAEGKTEQGFLLNVLGRAIKGDLLEHGIWVTECNGNDPALQLLEDLTKSRLCFAGFADNEGRSPERWKRVEEKLGALMFRWKIGGLEANIIPLVPDHQLELFVQDQNGNSGERLRTLADRLGLAEKGFTDIQTKATDLKRLIVEAASGTVPEGLDEKKKKEWKGHGSRWFKSIAGGRELAEKVFSFGLWPTLEPQLLPFVNAVRKAVDLQPIDHIHE